MSDFNMGKRFACISPFLHFWLHFPPQRRSCRFIPHLLCTADTGKQVQGSSFRERRAGKTEQASRELTRALGEPVAAERWITLRPSTRFIHMPGKGNKAGMEDEQKGRALSPPELAQKYAPARRSATWTCWETQSQASLAHHTGSNSALVGICQDASWKFGPISRSYLGASSSCAQESTESAESACCQQRPDTSRSRNTGLVSVPPVTFIQICVIFGRPGHL